MAMMPFNAKDWVKLGFDMETHGVEMCDHEFFMVFKTSKHFGPFMFAQLHDEIRKAS
jgi:hypothetical protein